LGGNPRFSGASIDMGAYEHQSSIAHTGGIVYVKEGGAGTQTGESWTNAFPNLADPLKYADLQRKSMFPVAPADTVRQIWVAAGTYYPRHRAAVTDGNNDPTTDRDKAFVLVEGVKVYGGFPAGANDGTHTARQTFMLTVIRCTSLLPSAVKRVYIM
jgi:hypothetical protein